MNFAKAAIMTKSFKLCATHYLTQWWEMDRGFIHTFSHGRIGPAALREVCVKYGVNRNIPGHEAERYERFGAILENFRQIEISRETVPRVVEKAVKKLSAVYGERVLSATTKAIWMLRGHPVVIYDNWSCQGLQKQSGLCRLNRNYPAYFKAWFDFFESPDTERGIVDAQEWLLSSDFVRSLAEEWNSPWDETRMFIGSDRFRNRVVDMYLFHLGKDHERSAAQK
jgi:hypothetical protein